jgi:segregation and condensation protein A
MAVSILRTSANSDPAPFASAPADPASPYLVHLPGFDGPLALLLHLIERSQLEITTISLVAVTDQFVFYLRNWKEPPLPRLAEFVAMAARLLLIKSRSLLPRQGQPAEAGDYADPLEDAEQLRRHLIEYKRAREIAQALRERELAGLQSFARPTMLMDAETLITRTPPQIVGVNAEALAAVFRRVLAEKVLSQPETLPPPLVTIAEKMAEVEGVLRTEGHTTLQAVLERACSRFEVVVMFLAVLELWHQARLIVTQEDLFGTIQLRPGPHF